MMPRTYKFTLAPLNPSGSVDLVPAADPPPEQELEPVALKMRPQCPQSLLSGSRPASTSETHTPVTSFSLASCYVCHASMPPLTSPRVTPDHRRNICFLSHDHDIATATHLVRAHHFLVFGLLSSFLTSLVRVGTPSRFRYSNPISFCTRCCAPCLLVLLLSLYPSYYS